MGTVVPRPDGAAAAGSLINAKNCAGSFPEHLHVEFHETGRAACFWMDVERDEALTAQGDIPRIEALIVRAMAPVVAALEATGEINGVYLEQYGLSD